MQEILAEHMDVMIKKSDAHVDKWCLVHDRTTVKVLVPPGGKTWTSETRTMLVGTEKELRDEIKRLDLTELEQRDKIVERSTSSATIPTLVVTGTLNPDATGRYLETGIYNGESYYKHESESYCIYCGVETWQIGEVLPADPILWGRESPDGPIGDYGADTGTGIATVTWM